MLAAVMVVSPNPRQRRQRLLVVVLSFLLPLCYDLRLSSGQQQYVPFAPTCSVTENYTDGSNYDINLEELLQRLPRSAASQSSQSGGGFAMDTVGSSPDQVFGLMMCYADSDTFQCQTCLDQAAASIVQNCSRSSTVAACFDSCVVRYGSSSFFSVATLTWEFTWTSDSDVSSADGGTLSRVRQQLMNDLIDGIPQSAPLLLTPGNRTFNNQTMYGLVQCTRDLPVSECQRCLKSYLPQLSENFGLSMAGRFYGYSCYMRYDLDYFVVNIVPQPHIDGSSSKKKVATIAGVGCAAALLIALAVVLLLRRRSRRRPPAATSQLAAPTKFTLTELQVATKNFGTKIGSGAFGNVYKGQLPDGEVIAVKELLMGDRLDGFEKESEILGALRHRHIVGLVGYCHEGGRYMLCCEFVPDGNLEEHLFGNKMRFDWPTRFNIIKGVCRGLIYLHEDSRRCTVHLDLKHSNILLHKNARGDVEPKISDFGVSKLLERDKADHETIHRIVGSCGYMAPEYLHNGIVSTKADVYSFGIVILEMITGLRNRAFSSGDLADEFIEYVRRQWNNSGNGNGNINEIRDRAMGDKYSVPEICQCIEIAFKCVQKEPTNRPDAKTIYHRIFDDGNAQV